MSNTYSFSSCAEVWMEVWDGAQKLGRSFARIVVEHTVNNEMRPSGVDIAQSAEQFPGQFPRRMNTTKINLFIELGVLQCNLSDSSTNLR
jgi:hypothetical protein